MEIISHNFLGGWKESHEKPQSIKSLTRSLFEPDISAVEVRCITAGASCRAFRHSPVYRHLSNLSFADLKKKKKNVNSHNGRGRGGSENWVHSARRPLLAYLYLPRVIVRMENLVEWRLAGETEVLGENFVHHKSHLTKPGLKPGPPRLEARDSPLELWRDNMRT
jgi:hypothetical protein